MRRTFVHPETRTTIREIRLTETRAVQRRVDAAIVLCMEVGLMRSDAS